MNPNLFLLVSVILFTLGVLVVLTRRGAIVILMGVELMLNGANLAFIGLLQGAGSTRTLLVLSFVTLVVQVPLSLVLAFPLVFAGLLALTFGGSGGGMPKVHLLVEDRDDSMLSGLLVGALGNEQMAEFFRVEPAGADGLARMENGEASALLRIPEGFASDLLAGKPLTLELIRNPA